MLTIGPAVSSALVVGLGLAISAAAAEPERREWIVDGVAREALVCMPVQAVAKAVPVVFVFHGHGGSMRHMSRNFPCHTLWPEALVVYMQGIPTPGRLTDPEGKKAGWQNAPGDQGDRDLKFFDAVMETLRTTARIDGKHVYATGHSNGGGFTYLLWATRAYCFDAFAPCAAVTTQLAKLTPKPVLHVAGEKDPLVKFVWQQRTLEVVRKVNRCGSEGRPWGTNATLYASSAGAPVIALIHPGGHELPPEALPSIVRFFKERADPPLKASLPK
jgi:polyhydroxybutyrate depolymerase